MTDATTTQDATTTDVPTETELPKIDLLDQAETGCCGGSSCGA